jgi:hypothetical protein
MKSKYLVIALLAIVAVCGSCGGKKEKSSEKAIKEFWVNGVEYAINGTYISYLYPKTAANTWTGWVSMPVAPSKVVLSAGATIDPPVTAERDFMQEQTYTVTAEDGSKQTYKVKADRTMYVE